MQIIQSESMFDILQLWRAYSVGFEVVTVSDNVPGSPGSFSKKTTGDFRQVSNRWLSKILKSYYIFKSLDITLRPHYNTDKALIPMQHAGMSLNVSSFN